VTRSTERQARFSLVPPYRGREAQARKGDKNPAEEDFPEAMHDETSIKVRGKWCSLYRAIDHDGNLVDSRLMRQCKSFQVESCRTGSSRFPREKIIHLRDAAPVSLAYVPAIRAHMPDVPGKEGTPLQ
jgi:hypothetical protein